MAVAMKFEVVRLNKLCRYNGGMGEPRVWLDLRPSEIISGASLTGQPYFLL